MIRFLNNRPKSVIVKKSIFKFQEKSNQNESYSHKLKKNKKIRSKSSIFTKHIKTSQSSNKRINLIETLYTEIQQYKSKFKTLRRKVN